MVYSLHLEESRGGMLAFLPKNIFQAYQNQPLPEILENLSIEINRLK